MKSHIHIFALLVVASTLLSSCVLLAPSPIHYSNPHPYFADQEPGPYGGNHKVYNGVIEVPAEGGIYEFDCADDKFYISRIFDSSMPVPDNYSNCRYSPKANDYKSVNDYSYSGSFYTITCNKDEHNWVIKVEPLMAASGEYNYRDIWVYMWDGSDGSHFIFQFEQSDDGEGYGYIE